MKNPVFTPNRSDINFMKSFKAIDVPWFLNLSDTVSETHQPFPIDCLEPFQLRFVQEAVESMDVDDGAFASSMLAAWSGCLGKSFVGYHNGSGKPTYPNLHLLLSMNQGVGKSLVGLPFNASREFEELNRKRYELNRIKCEMDLLEISDRVGVCRSKLKHMKGDSVEARMQRAVWRELSRQESELQGGLEAPSFMEDSITGAALIEALKTSDDALTVQSSEAGGSVKDLLRSANSGSANLFDLLLKGYSVDPLAERKVTRGQYKGRPCIALSWLVQPELGREIASNIEFRKRGLVSRWLFVERDQPSVEYELHDRLEPDQRVMTEWRRMVFVAMQKRLKSRGTPVVIDWNKTARSVFRSYHNEITVKRLSEWSSHGDLFVRSRENAVRIAIGLFAARYLSGGGVTRDEQPVFAERAITISRWFEAERYRHFQSCDLSGHKVRFSELVELLLSAPDQEVTYRDLKNRNGYSAAELEVKLSLFPTRIKKIIKLPGTRGGRKSEVLKLTLL